MRITEEQIIELLQTNPKVKESIFNNSYVLKILLEKIFGAFISGEDNNFVPPRIIGFGFDEKNVPYIRLESLVNIYKSSQFSDLTEMQIIANFQASKTKHEIFTYFYYLVAFHFFKACSTDYAFSFLVKENVANILRYNEGDLFDSIFNFSSTDIIEASEEIRKTRYYKSVQRLIAEENLASAVIKAIVLETEKDTEKNINNPFVRRMAGYIGKFITYYDEETILKNLADSIDANAFEDGYKQAEDKLIEFLDKANDEISHLEGKVENLQMSLTEAEEEIENLEYKLREARDEAYMLDEEVSLLKHKIEILEKQLQDCEWNK